MKEKHRDEKLRKAARNLPCGGCGVDDDTTVWAHSNSGRHGKGLGTKAHDCFGAVLCARCHWWYDAGPASREEKREFFIHAFENTVLALWLSGTVGVQL